MSGNPDEVIVMTRGNDCRRPAPAPQSKRGPARRFGTRDSESSGERVLAELRAVGRTMLDPSVPRHLADIVLAAKNRRR